MISISMAFGHTRWRFGFGLRPCAFAWASMAYGPYAAQNRLMKAILASQNAHKAAEFAAAVPAIQIVPAPHTIDVDENDITFTGNARLKACAYAQAFAENTLADDSGLCVDALGGNPGVHSARFAALPPNPDDDPDRTAANNRKLLRLLSQIPAQQRQAHFICALRLIIVQHHDISNMISLLHHHISSSAVDNNTIQFYQNDIPVSANDIIMEKIHPNRIEIAIEGRSDGMILSAPKGNHGFGYDPLFYSPEAGCTFAELTAQQKLSISHRGRAIAQLNALFQ